MVNILVITVYHHFCKMLPLGGTGNVTQDLSAILYWINYLELIFNFKKIIKVVYLPSILLQQLVFCPLGGSF